jgi:hypothetical protein
MKPKIPKDVKGALLDLYYNGNDRDTQILAGIVLELFKKMQGGVMKESHITRGADGSEHSLPGRSQTPHRVVTTVTTGPVGPEDEDEPDQFINHYRCPYDGTEWDDASPYTNNDRCPECNKEIEPYDSEGITDISETTFTPGGKKLTENTIRGKGASGEGEWVEGTFDSEGRTYFFQAKVYGERSEQYGVLKSAVSKLVVCDGSRWDSRTILYDYDRGVIMDSLDDDLLRDIITYIETESGVLLGEE